MGPFWLVAVRGKNFRSFQELDIQFQRNGLTLARGHNLDTGGSSYSGKSTIGLAIAWALGYLPYSAKDQRRWGAEGPTWVELDVGTDAGECTIRVGDKPSLKLPDGRRVTSATAIKDELAKFLGVVPDVLAALTWQRQKRGSRFLTKTDSEKKEFLSNVMPFLTKLEQVADATDVEIKRIQANLAAGRRLVEQEESTLRSLVVSEPVQVTPSSPAVLEALEAERTQLWKRKSVAQSVLDQVEGRSIEVEGYAELAGALAQAEGRENALRDLEYERVRVHNLKKTAIERQIYAASNKAKSVGWLQQQISALQADTCPTCNQVWVENPIQLGEYVAELRQAVEAQQILPGLILESERLVFVPDPKIAQLAAARKHIATELDKLQTQKEAKWDAKAADKAKVEKEISEIERLEYLNKLEIAKARHADEIAEKENAHRRADYDAAVGRREAVVAKLDTYRADVEKDAEALRAEEDFQAMIGRSGFLGSIFDEVLREISEETNSILKAVANTAHVSVEFLSEVSTLKGKINKVITPAVTIGGNRADLESGASGGMETSIGLAVDLAVATVISRRTNTWPGWLILDESFEGLDQVSKEACMAILKVHACNRLVVVVDHAAETKELFANFIDIEFQNGVSKVL